MPLTLFPPYLQTRNDHSGKRKRSSNSLSCGCLEENLGHVLSNCGGEITGQSRIHGRHRTVVIFCIDQYHDVTVWHVMQSVVIHLKHTQAIYTAQAATGDLVYTRARTHRHTSFGFTKDHIREFKSCTTITNKLPFKTNSYRCAI